MSACICESLRSCCPICPASMPPSLYTLIAAICAANICNSAICCCLLLFLFIIFFIFSSILIVPFYHALLALQHKYHYFGEEKQTTRMSFLLLPYYLHRLAGIYLSMPDFIAAHPPLLFVVSTISFDASKEHCEYFQHSLLARCSAGAQLTKCSSHLLGCMPVGVCVCVMCVMCMMCVMHRW